MSWPCELKFDRLYRASAQAGVLAFLDGGDGLHEVRRDAKSLDDYCCREGGRVNVLETRGDGACFFRSIAYALKPDERYLESYDAETLSELRRIRQSFVSKVIELWDTGLFDGGTKLRDLVRMEHGKDTRDSYREYMSEQSTWAGQPEVLVAQDIYQGGLTVFQRVDDGFLKKRYGTGPTSLKIFYNGTDHYSAVEQEA